MAVLRKQLDRDAVNAIWQRARGASVRAGMPCPACSRPMAEAAVHRGPRELVVDACDRCQIVWFDAREMDALPLKPPPFPRERPSPTEAEAIVRLQVERARESQLVHVDLRRLDAVTDAMGQPFVDESVERRRAWVTWTLMAIVAAAVLGQLLAQLSDPSSYPRPRGGWGWRRRHEIVGWVFDWGFLARDPWRHGAATVLTSLFLHGSVLLAAVSAYGLMLAGTVVEPVLGRLRTALLFVAGGVCGCLLHAAVAPDTMEPRVGAFGGVTAILAAYGVLLPRAKLRLLPIGSLSPRIGAPVALALWVGTTMLVADAMRWTTHRGSLGGLLAGLAAGSWWRSRVRPRAGENEPRGPTRERSTAS